MNHVAHLHRVTLVPVFSLSNSQLHSLIHISTSSQIPISFFVFFINISFCDAKNLKKAPLKMATKLFLTRLRHQTTFNLPHYLRSPSSTPTSTPLHFRRFSGIAQTLPNQPSSSQQNPQNFPIDSKIDVNGESNSRVSIKSSLNDAELAKFSAIADTWWDADGPFKPLHALNPTRLAFIRSTLCHHFRKDPDSARPFEGLNFIDVGCGGGILSEPLARMGATVTGVDAVDRNIKIARLHAESDPATSSIEYLCTTAENLVEEQRQFDAVLALEVIEHVADPAEFCKSLAALTVPNGATVISTVNRTMRAYATAIVAAEYILHWLPKGTHEWSKFLTPEELVLILQRTSVTVQEMAGFVYNPLSGKWLLSDDISVNFIAFGVKSSDE